MSDPYDELYEDELCLRLPPGERHELVCTRLHERMASSLSGNSVVTLLPVRTMVQLTPDTKLRPDLALVTAATNKLFLAVEIVNSGDHSPDTVHKKNYYEQSKLPRLWMVDPRYDNVEIYHGGPHGLILKEILAIKDVLTEPLVPGFSYGIAELFAPQI
jgi:Uma2 family endonuclease